MGGGRLTHFALRWSCDSISVVASVSLHGRMLSIHTTALHYCKVNCYRMPMLKVVVRTTEVYMYTISLLSLCLAHTHGLLLTDAVCS